MLLISVLLLSSATTYAFRQELLSQPGCDSQEVYPDQDFYLVQFTSHASIYEFSGLTISLEKVGDQLEHFEEEEPLFYKRAEQLWKQKPTNRQLIWGRFSFIQPENVPCTYSDNYFICSTQILSQGQRFTKFFNFKQNAYLNETLDETANRFIDQVRLWTFDEIFKVNCTEIAKLRL